MKRRIGFYFLIILESNGRTIDITRGITAKGAIKHWAKNKNGKIYREKGRCYYQQKNSGHRFYAKRNKAD